MAKAQPKIWASHRCGAKLSGGRVCGKWAVRGAERCATHGSGTKLAHRKAERRLALDAIRKEVVTYGGPIDVDPVDALLQELARTNGHIEWIGERIRELDDKDVIWGAISNTERSGVGDENNWSEEKVGAVAHIWIELYFRERAHLVRLGDLMIKNGLAEMQIVLAAKQVEAFEMAMLNLLGDLRIDATTPEVRVIIGTRLTEAAAWAALPVEIP